MSGVVKRILLNLSMGIEKEEVFMKTLLTAAAALFTVLAISSQAQALDFAPAFKSCEVKTKGSNTSLVLLGGSETRGTITCKKSNGKKVYQNIVVPMVGLSLGVGHCSMEMDLSFAGADLGIDLTKKNIRDIFVLADIGPVVPGKRSLAVVLPSVDLENAGASAAIGNITYGKGCLQLASVKIGGMYDAEAYDRKKAERKARQEQMQNDR